MNMLGLCQVYILRDTDLFLLQYMQALCQSRLRNAVVPILFRLCYNGSLDTWTAVSLTAAKFQPLIISVSGFPSSYAANMFVLMILYWQGSHKNTASSIVVSLSFSVDTCLPRRCQATATPTCYTIPAFSHYVTIWWCRLYYVLWSSPNCFMMPFGAVSSSLSVDVCKYNIVILRF
jgi:hypothetical protein